MKQICLISALVIMFLSPLLSHAETFCVSNATELQDALSTAASNDEDDTIQIVQGNYVGSFIYVSTEDNNLIVEGGYTSGCGSRVVDPTNTVLDGNGAGSVLVFSTPDTEANLEVDGITLQNGVAGNGKGGGIYANTHGSITFTNNTISNNSAGDDGGGVKTSYSPSSITFTNNTISSNSAGKRGGGVSAFADDSITFTNNTISGNSANKEGGGILAVSSGFVTFTNNTISGNSAGDGGGFYLWLSYNDAVADFINNIIWNNTVAEGLADDLYINNDGNDDTIPSTVNLYNNDFDQSVTGTYIEIPFPIDPSNLNNEDPLFVDAASGDYHLTTSSPCVDVGRLEGAPADDMDGDPRPIGDGVDIGADEFDPAAPPTTTSTSSTISTTTTIQVTTTTTTSISPPTTTTIRPSTTTSPVVTSTPPTPITTPPPITIIYPETTTTMAGSSTTTTIRPTPDTTTTTTKECCPSKKIYGEPSEEVELLRYIRDNVLNKTPEGQALIRLYYEWSPVVVKAMENDEVFKEDVKEMIDGVLGLVIEEGE